MRPRTLSLVLAGLAILVFAGSAFAQVVRTDAIVGFSGVEGVPSVAEGTFSPTVAASDATSADIGTGLAPYVADLDAWFATNFGWRSSRPVTFVLFSNGEDMVNAVGTLRGSALSPDERNQVLSRPSFLMQATQSGLDIQAGDWAILVNTDIDAATQLAQDLNSRFLVEASILPVLQTSFGPEDGMRQIQWSMARDLAALMEMDVAGTAGPFFYRAGLADAAAFRVVPGTPQESGQPRVVTDFLVTNTLPSLSDIEQNWISLVSTGGESFDLARGVAFLSTNTVLNQVGGVSALNILRATASGEEFESALQSATGLSLFDLNTAYQSLIPQP